MTPLLKPLRPNSTRRHVRWHQLHGSATALALAECMDNDSRLYVVVADGARELERLAANSLLCRRSHSALLRCPTGKSCPTTCSLRTPTSPRERLQTLFELPQERTAA
jgi:transcription-repair coupling factor (superfamily II helicase)